MKLKKVYAKNADYQKFEVLKTNRNKRYRYGEFFVEGVRNLNEAIENGWEISSFLYAPERGLSDWAKGLLKDVKTQVNYELSAELLSELSGKEDASELLAVVKMREDSLAPFLAVQKKKPLFVLFDRPSNRGNLGTLLRTCDAFGVDGLLLTGHGVDLYDPEVVGASMGSFFNVPAVRVQTNEDVFAFMAQMREKHPGFLTVGTTAHKQHPIWGETLTGPLLLMVGNETDGLCYAFKEACDLLCTIPLAETSSASSFNVACAATAMLYEATRQRQAAAGTSRQEK